MKVFAVLGSTNPEGQTASAVEALLSAVEAKGGETQSVLLPEKKIERCRQCGDRGWGVCRDEGRCIIEDDFASVVDQMRGADAVVFGTPVYFSDLSESARAFLDRLRRITRQEKGKEGILGKPAVGICVAGGGGGGAPSCSFHLDTALNRIGFEVVDMVPVRRQNLEIKKRLLAMTGEWLAGQLSEE